MRWLVPRFEDFRGRHPSLNINIQLMSPMQTADLDELRGRIAARPHCRAAAACLTADPVTIALEACEPLLGLLPVLGQPRSREEAVTSRRHVAGLTWPWPELASQAAAPGRFVLRAK